jgi:hypothetical protein
VINQDTPSTTLDHSSPDDIGHFYVLLLLQNRAADALKLARAIIARGPEAVASAMEVVGRLRRTQPDLALTGQVLLMLDDGGGGVRDPV